MTAEKKYTILCVDDEEDIVDSLYDTFMDDYKVITALNGKDALKKFDEEDIFLVISDQRMPEMSGSELLSEINKKEKNCKKILLTGYADINATVDAINKGSVDKYLSKPWDDDEILSTVKHLESLYKMDLFAEKMLAGGKGLKEKLDESIKTTNTLENFIDNYPAGICIVNNQGKIIHLSQKAMNILRCDDQKNVLGSDFKEIFLLNERDISKFEKKFQQGILNFDLVEAKICDASEAKLELGIIFYNSPGGSEIIGLIFNSRE